jgi:hypothetical protein
MPEQYDRQLFEQIFSDAHVVDVDFSRWDERVSLYVVADHAIPSAADRLAVFVVNFERVFRFSVDFNHFEVKLDEAHQHFQWNIDDFSIREDQKHLAISLFGGATWPRLEIQCEKVAIRRIANSVLDELFPGWNKPYSGLARPGIEALYALRSSENR